jgi:hypothetical protein
MMLIILSKDTIATLCQLHPFPSYHVPPLICDYQFEHIFVLDRILFTHTLAITPHSCLSGLLKMVYEHLSRCFIPKDPSSEFSKLLQSYYYCCLYPWVNGLNVGG